VEASNSCARTLILVFYYLSSFCGLVFYRLFLPLFYPLFSSCGFIHNLPQLVWNYKTWWWNCYCTCVASSHHHMASTEGQHKLCYCYHHYLVVEPPHLLSIYCSLQIHVAPMFHSFQTDNMSYRFSELLKLHGQLLATCIDFYHQKWYNTCGKHIGIPPRTTFGGFKIACT
jgi:hypothetical protein